MKWLLAGLLVTMAVSGCVEDQPTTSTSVVTDPSDYSYVEESPNQGHLHDYWNGQTELGILSASRSYNYNNLGGTSTAWVAAFFPEDGTVVPQGTSELHISVDWGDLNALGATPNSYSHLSLWVKPANNESVVLADDHLEHGETVVVALDYNQSDLPHQVISAWEFQVHVHGSADPYNLFVGFIDIDVVAIRGLELQPFPPHPDQWGNATEILWADHANILRQNRAIGNGDFDHRIGPNDGALVPLGTDRVEVILFFENDDLTGDIELEFHAADTRSFTRLTPDSEEPGDYRYTIGVDPGMVDGPYNEASIWEFEVHAGTSAQDSTFHGNYRIIVTAYKE